VPDDFRVDWILAIALSVTKLTVSVLLLAKNIYLIQRALKT